MTLPVIKPEVFTTTLPSTGEAIEFRPFLVKEEKLLMKAQESKDQFEVINAIKKIIQSCTFDRVNANKIKPYDLEFLFLMLRIKSVGSTLEIEYKCPHCEVVNNIKIDLTEAELYKPDEVDPNVELADGVGITLRIPDIEQAVKISEDDFVEALVACIDTIYDNDSVTAHTDVSKRELTSFVESFSRSHVEAMEKYITSQPTIRYVKTFTCSECGKEFEVKLEGLKDFFT